MPARRAWKSPRFEVERELRSFLECCPSCGRPYVLEKITKKDGTTRFCDSEGCGFKKAVNS
jgi:ssDNA-binding Zn-finger/Zn-ribbon topoisomerase 1